MKSERSRDTGLRQLNSIHNFHTLFLLDQSSLSYFHLFLCLVNGLIPSDNATEIQDAFLIATRRATCPALLIFIDFI